MLKPAMHGWTVVFESRNRAACADRALVLHSLGIPYDVVHDDLCSSLFVPAEHAERAKFEIWQYDQENRQTRRSTRPVLYEYQDGMPGAIAYIVVICLVAWLAGEHAFGQDWLLAGQVDGERIRSGEWWRAWTALTLHSGIGHLLGNLGFGAFFGFLGGRLVGSGVAWLGIVAAGGAGNALNTMLLDASHRSIGASTAVFAALGLLAGFVWRARLITEERWPYRLGPIVGGIALLAYTGTGDATTDIGAHMAGFICGLACGIFLTLVTKYLPSGKLQIVCGVAALATIVLAWLAAFAGT